MIALTALRTSPFLNRCPTSATLWSRTLTSRHDKGTEMLYFTTRDHIHGREILEEYGMVSATAVRSKSVLSDMYVAITGLVGGEASSYTSLMSETMAEAVHRMQYAAQSQGATAIVNVRFDSNTTMNRMVFGLHCSVIAYGTAVRCRPQTIHHHHQDGYITCSQPIPSNHSDQ